MFFLAWENKNMFFFFFGELVQICFHLRNQTKGLFFSLKNKTTFSLASDNKDVFCSDMSHHTKVWQRFHKHKLLILSQWLIVWYPGGV